MTNNLFNILDLYRCGLFPMADSIDDPDTFIVDPDQRGQLPILNLHIPRRLERTVRSDFCRVTIDTVFDQIIDLCAEQSRGRYQTWINSTIRNAFINLYQAGHAHSVEVWQADRLIGGLYGLALGQVFCGESMVSRARDASKVALVHLCARLYTGGFQVLDTQFVNDHLKQFGVYEIPRVEYHQLLERYRDIPADFIQGGQSSSDLLQVYFQARHLLYPSLEMKDELCL